MDSNHQGPEGRLVYSQVSHRCSTPPSCARAASGSRTRASTLATSLATVTIRPRTWTCCISFPSCPSSESNRRSLLTRQVSCHWTRRAFAASQGVGSCKTDLESTVIPDRPLCLKRRRAGSLSSAGPGNLLMEVVLGSDAPGLGGLLARIVRELPRERQADARVGRGFDPRPRFAAVCAGPLHGHKRMPHLREGVKRPGELFHKSSRSLSSWWTAAARALFHTPGTPCSTPRRRRAPRSRAP